MIQTRDDEIFNNLKTNIGFDRSKEHLEFIRAFGEPHHLFGSYTGIKTSDYACIPLSRTDHIEADKHRSEFAIANLYKLFGILIHRIKQQESIIKSLE